MIKIGKGFFDEEFRWGVVPNISYGESGKYMVILQNGVKVSIAANDGIVQQAMETLGYDPDSLVTLADMLSPDDAAELLPLVGEGYSWLAKDKRGFCYVFVNKPEMTGAYWEDPAEAPSKRVFCSCDFLDEGERIDLTTLEGDDYNE
jgi:hypothetical protein